MSSSKKLVVLLLLRSLFQPVGESLSQVSSDVQSQKLRHSHDTLTMEKTLSMEMEYPVVWIIILRVYRKKHERTDVKITNQNGETIKTGALINENVGTVIFSKEVVMGMKLKNILFSNHPFMILPSNANKDKKCRILVIKKITRNNRFEKLRSIFARATGSNGIYNRRYVEMMTKAILCRKGKNWIKHPRVFLLQMIYEIAVLLTLIIAVFLLSYHHKEFKLSHMKKNQTKNEVIVFQVQLIEDSETGPSQFRLEHLEVYLEKQTVTNKSTETEISSKNQIGDNVPKSSDSKSTDDVIIKSTTLSPVTVEVEVINRKNKRFFGENNFSLKGNGNINDLLEVFEEESFLEEDTEIIKLTAPPQNVQDEQSRLSTFRGLRTQVYAAEEFARGGFYCENGNDIICYSCQLQHGIDDIVESHPSDLQWHDHRCRHALRFRSIPPRGSNIDIVDEDGVSSDIVGDPPGQRSFYITPGDVRMEQYRLSTFEHYPIVPGFLALPSFRRSLAKNGFYFTGFNDRVKCFSCGRSVDEWNESDHTADRKWHKRTCSLKNGQQCDNVPIRFSFGDLLNTNAGHDTVMQQRNHNTGDNRTVGFPQDLPERVRQNGGSFNIGPGNQVQIQGGPVAQPQRGNEDQPRRNVASNQNSLGGQAPQPRGVPEPPRDVPTWRMAAVASQDHRRFLTNLYLNRELDRITSYARWPSDRPNLPPAALAKTGFYYLGDMDRVQCFSCGGVLRNWSLDDNAEREHRAHFGGCNMVLGIEPSNLPIPTHQESSQLLAVNYPLRFPQNPHMRGQAQREQTFDRRWPARALRVTVEEVSEAGFFYLGERDRVKCFYCNGGLQNWEFDDKPWDEHAKWFPNCQFLLRTKGQQFVSYHLAPNAQLARPIIARQDGSPLDRIGRPPVSSSRGHDIPPAERRPPTPPPTIIDPQAEMRERKERVKNIMRNSEVVKNVLSMGFSEQIVETLLIDRIVSNNEENPNDIYGTVSNLLDDVMKKEDEIRQEEEERRDQTQSIFSNPSAYSSMSTSLSTIGAAPGSGKYNVSYYGEDDDMNDIDMYGEGMKGTSDQGETSAKQLLNENTESLQLQMDKIEEERLCKICLSEVADMVFLPCSHMLCCMECTQAIKHCPVCRKRIERAIKTYVK